VTAEIVEEDQDPVVPAPALDIFQLVGKEAVVEVPIPLKFSVTAEVFAIEICPQPCEAKAKNARMIAANTPKRVKG
jgi:hypothetical protein